MSDQNSPEHVERAENLEHAENEQPLVAEDLIEEVSIDGMCGVY